MWETFLQLDEPQLLFLAGVWGITLTVIAAIAGFIAVQWRKLHLRELELAFKDDLLERGLSAADTELMWSGGRPAWWAKCGRLLSSCWRAAVSCCTALIAACRRFFSSLIRLVSQYQDRHARAECDFKRELLDRGLSVDDVERLTAARQPTLISWLSQTLISAVSIGVVLCRRVWNWGRQCWSRIANSAHYSEDWRIDRS